MTKHIFHISAHVALTQKPAWLDAFREVYDEPYEFHVSLKTATYFDIAKKSELLHALASISASYDPFDIVFDELHTSTGSSGECIMINATNNSYITSLQKEISHVFRYFGEHIAPAYNTYETHFIPHITIARSLSEAQFEQAKKDLGKDLRCVGVINSLICTTVQHHVASEYLKKKNQTLFRLGHE